MLRKQWNEYASISHSLNSFQVTISPMDLLNISEKRSKRNAFFVLKFVEHVQTAISLLSLIIYLRNNYFHRYNQTFRKAIANSFTFA